MVTLLISSWHIFHIMYMSKLPPDCSIRVFTIVHKINHCLTYMPIGTPMFSLKLYKQVSLLKSYCKAVRFFAKFVSDVHSV